jgi:hypothetical protein
VPAARRSSANPNLYGLRRECACIGRDGKPNPTVAASSDGIACLKCGHPPAYSKRKVKRARV